MIGYDWYKLIKDTAFRFTEMVFRTQTTPSWIFLCSNMPREQGPYLEDGPSHLSNYHGNPQPSFLNRILKGVGDSPNFP